MSLQLQLLLLLLLAIQLSWCYSFMFTSIPSFASRRNHDYHRHDKHDSSSPSSSCSMSRRSHNTLYMKDNWYAAENEVKYKTIAQDEELDKIYDQPDEILDDMNVIQDLSLQQISDAFGFTLHYLGDFVCTIGAQLPIKIKVPIKSYLDKKQMSSLLLAVTSLQPEDKNDSYDEELELDEVAKEYKIDVNVLLKICSEERINIPFGPYTKLHKSEMKRLQRILGSRFPHAVNTRIHQYYKEQADHEEERLEDSASVLDDADSDNGEARKRQPPIIA